MARHPIHPAIVHFPVACWSLATAADFASLFFGQTAWQWSAGLLSVGCVMAVVAMAAGLLELLRVPEGEALTHTYWHMGLMLTAFVLYGTRLFLGLDQLEPIAPSNAALAVSAIAFVALSVGGWFGGRLVYEHGIGR